MVKRETGAALITVLFAATLLGLLLMQALDVPRRINRRTSLRWEELRINTNALSKAAKAMDTNSLVEGKWITPSLFQAVGREKTLNTSRTASLFFTRKNQTDGLIGPTWRKVAQIEDIQSCKIDGTNSASSSSPRSAYTCEHIAPISRSTIIAGNLKLSEDLLLSTNEAETEIVILGKIEIAGTLTMDSSSANPRITIISLGDTLIKQLAITPESAPAQLLIYSERGRIAVEEVPQQKCTTERGLQVRLEAEKGVEIKGSGVGSQSKTKIWGCTMTHPDIWKEKRLIGIQIE